MERCIEREEEKRRCEEERRRYEEERHVEREEETKIRSATRNFGRDTTHRCCIGVTETDQTD